MAAPTDRDPVRLLADPPTPDAAHLSRLHDRLVVIAGEQELIDVAYATFDTPVGDLLVATTTDGLVRVAFDREDHDQVLIDLADRVSTRILHAPARLDPVRRQFEEYFASRRRSFDLTVDSRLSSGYRGEVLAHLPTIPYGHTRSYAQVATATGRPRAVRAVGSACAANPIPIVVPCHRVVRADGAMGGYRGGIAAKRALLDLEAA